MITTAQTHGADYCAVSARLVRSQILIGLGQWAEAQAECDLVIKSPVCAHDRNLTAAAVWGGYKARVALNLQARNLLDALKRWRTYARTSSDPSVVAPILADMVVHFAQTGQLNEAKAWMSDLEVLLDHAHHPAAQLAMALGHAALLAHNKDWRAVTGAYRAAIEHAAQLHDLLFEARANSGLAFALLELGDLESKNEGRERLSLAHSVLSRLNAQARYGGVRSGREAVWPAAPAAAAHFVQSHAGRAHPPRAGSAGAHRDRHDQSADCAAFDHQREDRRRPRGQHPRQVELLQPHQGGRAGPSDGPVGRRRGVVRRRMHEARCNLASPNDSGWRDLFLRRSGCGLQAAARKARRAGAPV